MGDVICDIEVGLIDIPAHMRRHSPEKLAELKENIGKRGLLQNIVVVKKDNGRYELVAGQGRLLIAIEEKWATIKCLVKENLTDYERERLALSENEEREDLTPVDRGLTYKRLMELGKLTQEQLAKDLNKTQGYISQYVAAAELAEPVQEIINRLIIGIRHISQILRLPTPEAQAAMAEKCGKEDLSVKQLENLVNNALKAGNKEKEVADKDGKAFTDGFRIGTAAERIHIIGDFPEGASVADMHKALDESYAKWQELKAEKREKGIGTANPKDKAEGTPSSLLHTTGGQAQSASSGQADGPTTSAKREEEKPAGQGKPVDTKQAASQSAAAANEKLKQQVMPQIDQLKRKRQALIDKSDPDLERQIVETGQKRENLIKMIDEQLERFKKQFGE